MALIGLCDSYFPGLKPDGELGVMCQQAQVYKAGGELGQGDHSIVVAQHGFVYSSQRNAM